MCKVTKIKWKMTTAVKLEAGNYELIIVPKYSGNIALFKNTKLDINLLNAPSRRWLMKKISLVFGIPPLYPPNRVANGEYSFEGKKYQAKINDKDSNSWIHGTVIRKEWTLVSSFSNEQYAEAVVAYTHNSKSGDYSNFPFDFEYQIVYHLSEEGLTHTSRIINMSKNNIPVGIGYHTTFSLPIGKGKLDNTHLCVSIKKKCILDKNGIPTGEVEKLSSNEELLANGGISPVFEPLDNLYEAGKIKLNDRLVNAAILEDKKNKIKIIYETDDNFKYWVIWNCDNNGRFISLEPQTCSINAINAKDYDSVNLVVLSSGESYEAATRLYISDMKRLAP